MVPENLKVSMEPSPLQQGEGTTLFSFPSAWHKDPRGPRGWAQTTWSDATSGQQPSDKTQGWPGNLLGSVT